MKNTILSARDLCKSFAQNGTQNHILTNVNLDIYEGDFTVIMGSSGSGKSTLLYSLSGMDKITSGKILYNNDDISKMNERKLSALRHKDFGFVFQQMHLVSNLSFFENIVVPGYLNKENTSAEVKKRANELLEQMSISHIATHLPSQASGGEQQRCAIARAVINSPKLLFADEPTGALNRKNTTEVLNLFTELNSQGQSILMVTHDLTSALRANRIIYIGDGKVIGELTLAPYNKSEEKSREQQVNAWLASMEW